MAARTAARVKDSTGTASTSAPAILGSSRSIAVLVEFVKDRPSRDVFTRVSNVCARATPQKATADRPATRDTVLLTPDATPPCSLSTAAITVIVSGTTVMAIAIPSTATGGKSVVQYDPPI